MATDVKLDQVDGGFFGNNIAVSTVSFSSKRAAISGARTVNIGCRL